MSKKAIFKMELRAGFMAGVADEAKPASQVMRELMRGYIEQRLQAHDYDAYMRTRFETGRASIKASRGP